MMKLDIIFIWKIINTMKYCIMKMVQTPTRNNNSKQRSNYSQGDFAIQTDRRIKTNRPDLVVKNYKRKHVF